jgi:hypothetical protein
LVKYSNIEKSSGKPIKYWNIGNEPWLQAKKPAIPRVGAMVEAYFKPIAAAMKDVHGASSQKSDIMVGNPANYPTGRGPQGDAVRIYNFVRLVRGGLTAR